MDRPWSEDDLKLADLYAIGMPMRMIADQLGRTRGAVKLRVFNCSLRRDPTRFHEFASFVARPGERWAPVRFAPLYFVSDHGRVLSMTSHGMGKFKMPTPDEYGYLRLCLVTPDGKRHAHLHRLVAQHFVDGEAPGLEAAHWDGVKPNCAASNLRWATSAENIADKKRHGTSRAGDDHPKARLRVNFERHRADAVVVRAALDLGMSARAASKAAGVSYDIAKRIKSGKSWHNLEGVAA